MAAKIVNGIGIFLMIVVILIVLPFTVPKIFGYKVFGILTESMEPEYPAGCAVFVKNVEFEDIKVGDPITYHMGTDTEYTATHRVLEINKKDQKLITKGDANSSEDIAPVSYGQVIGKVAFYLPFIGTISLFLHSQAGVFICGFIFLLSIFLWIIADRIKLKESTK